jgi:hypothetical protein
MIAAIFGISRSATVSAHSPKQNGSEQESVKVVILRGFFRSPHFGSQPPYKEQNRKTCRKFDNSLWK